MANKNKAGNGPAVATQEAPASAKTEAFKTPAGYTLKAGKVKVGKGNDERTVEVKILQADNAEAVIAALGADKAKAIFLESYNNAQWNKAAAQNGNAVRRALKGGKKVETAVETKGENGEVSVEILVSFDADSLKAIDEAIVGMQTQAPVFIYGLTAERKRGRKSDGPSKKQVEAVNSWAAARIMQGVATTRDQLIAHARTLGYTDGDVQKLFAPPAA